MAIEKRSVKVGELSWCYLDAKPNSPEDRPPVVLLHGILAQSYSWRPVMEAIAKNGQRAIAPDWIGYGMSDKPSAKEFDYSPEGYLAAFTALLDELQLEKVALVVQGFLGSVGIQYALANRDRVERLAIIDAPFYGKARVPFKLAQLGYPAIGEMLTQDPLCVDRTLEGGGGKIVPEQDLEIYRNPHIRSSDAGWALLATVRRLNFKATVAEIEAGLANWKQPTLVAWGTNDTWLKVNAAEEAAKALPSGEFRKIEGAGHYAQIDEGDRLCELIPPFLRRQVFRTA